MSTDAVQIVRRYLEAFAAGDVAGIRDSFAEDITWTLYADLPHLPDDGVWRGRDHIVDDFLGRWGPLLFEPGTIAASFPTVIGQGDTVAVEWTIQARTSHGSDYHNHYAGFFVVKDGRIQTIREYLDSGYAARTLFPDAPA